MSLSARRFPLQKNRMRRRQRRYHCLAGQLCRLCCPKALVRIESVCSRFYGVADRFVVLWDANSYLGGLQKNQEYPGLERAMRQVHKLVLMPARRAIACPENGGFWI